jgi:hypothetical protein
MEKTTMLDTAISVRENTIIRLPDNCIGVFIQNQYTDSFGNYLVFNGVKINDGIIIYNNGSHQGKISFMKYQKNIKIAQIFPTPLSTPWEVVIIPLLEV